MELDPNENLTQIVTALDDERYQWRTVQGIVNQTNLPRENVHEALVKLIEDGAIIRSAVQSERGEDLYSTRDRYKQFTPIAMRLGAAFRNQVQ